MPLVEQRRRPCPDPASRQLSLTSFLPHFLSRSLERWPLTWALLHLAGLTWGGWLGPHVLCPGFPADLLPFEGWIRLAGVVPVGFAVRPSRWVGVLWLSVFGLSFIGGVVESDSRRQRVAATAEQPWACAEPLLENGRAIVRITGWPAPSARSTWRAPARVVAWRSSLGDTNVGLSPGTGILLKGEGHLPTPGELLATAIECRVPPVATLPGGFDYRGFLTGRSIQWTGRTTGNAVLAPPDPVSRFGTRILGPVRDSILERLDRLLPSRESNLAGAVLLGRRTRDSRSASRPFGDLGLAHLFSVSGLHVGILLGIFLLPGTMLSVSPWMKVVPLAIALPLYVLLTGMPGSVIRAAGLGFLGLAAGVAGRRVDPLHLVGLLFWFGTMWEPIQNLDTGLRLSYLAAGGILAVGRSADESGLLGRGWVKAISTGVMVSLAAQWFTLPQVAASFGRISLLSPLANLIAVPVFGLALWCVVLALLSGALWPWLGEAMAAWAWLMFRSLAGLVQWSATSTGGGMLPLPVPGPFKIICLAGLSVMLLSVLKSRRTGLLGSLPVRRSAVLIVLMTGFLVVAPAKRSWLIRSDVELRQIDVGQGDCAVLQFPDGWTAIIDTAGRFGRSPQAEGPVSRSVIPYLQRNGIESIDAIVLTHDHLDHTGGTRALAESFAIEKVLCGGRAAESVADFLDSNRVAHPLAGEVLHRWENWTLEVLFPKCELPADFSENNRSLVIGLKYRNRFEFVFSGDLEIEGEALWGESGEFPQGVAVWKAGHHGSDTSGSEDLLESMRPELVLISCGVGNGYEHPSHGPYYAAGEMPVIWRTDLHGTLHVHWSGEGERWISSP